MSLVYRAATLAARAASPLLSGGTSKLAQGVTGRRTAHGILRSWGEAARDPSRPTVWLHAPSIGEALQGGAVLEALREPRPDLQVAFTHFSPSAAGIGARIGADVSAYLPWDLPGPIGEALDALRPDVAVFTKTEVWPVLVEQAVGRGIPVAMVAATVPPGAGRLRWPVRGALRPSWAALGLACACSQDDAERLALLGVPPGNVHVTGDPAVDAAAARAASADSRSPVLAPFHADPRPTIVAGSTWPEDEAELLPALAELRRSVARVRLVLALHEPTGARVRALLAQLKGAGWRAGTLLEVEKRGSASDFDAVLVERVGVLAQLYTVADVAYVGGGFGRRGLHSVLEPAAAGVPVVFGPRHRRSAAAEGLLRAGGASTAADRKALYGAIARWLTEAEAREQAGEHAFVYIGTHLGAARRTAELLDPLLPFRPSAMTKP